MFFSVVCAASRVVSVSQAVLLNKSSTSITLFQGLVFVFDFWGCCRLHGHEDCNLPNQWVSLTTCYWDSCLLHNIACWADLIFLFSNWIDVFRCSCGFGELAAVGCCTTEDSRAEPNEQINYVQVIDGCNKESGFTELPVAESSWMVYVGCSLGVKEEKACLALINDSSDGMGGGRKETES